MSVAWSPDGKLLATGCGIFASDILLWNPQESNVPLLRSCDHSGSVFRVSWSPSGAYLASASADRTIHILDVSTGRVAAMLRGHTDNVVHVAFSHDGRFLASKSTDSTVRVWRSDSWEEVARIPERCAEDAIFSGIAFHPSELRLATCGDGTTTLRLWQLDESTLLKAKSTSVKFASAKVVLAGNTGVGKTALSIRMAHRIFQPNTVSTDGVWASHLQLLPEECPQDCDREIWLWDFAGQNDYRLIHKLFLAHTAVAVLVFNPQDDDPFDGIAQWDEELRWSPSRPFKRILVAGRCDRGGVTVSDQLVTDCISDRDFDGYYRTSALTGEGCEELRSAILRAIPWDRLPYITSPKVFRVLQNELQTIKQDGHVLMRQTDLYTTLRQRLSRTRFTIDELSTVLHLLVASGVMWQLDFGEFILLQPERISSYAAALSRKVRNNADEIGAILEADLLDGKLDYQDMKRLPASDEQIVLLAIHHTLISRGICLRQEVPTGTVLVFPSYFRRSRPDSLGTPNVLVTYKFRGALNQTYNALVVQLSYTAAFNKPQLWRFAADFTTHSGKQLGFIMVKKSESFGEISIHCDPDIPDDTKVTFVRYIHEYLMANVTELERFRRYTCPKCNSPVMDQAAIAKRLAMGLEDIGCAVCDSRVTVRDIIEARFNAEETQQSVIRLEEQSRSGIDNESRELILVGYVFAIVGQAGHIYRSVANSDWGIDGEIEFKSGQNEATGSRLYLQLKSGDSYLRRRRDGSEVFVVKHRRHVEYWQSHKYPVMLVVRTSDGVVRWMDIGRALSEQQKRTGKLPTQVVFNGEPFTVESVRNACARESSVF